MRVVAIGTDLLIGSKLESVSMAAGADFARVAGPGGLPSAPQIDLLLVDWSDATPDWASALAEWRAAAGTFAPRMYVFGPHTDLAAHAQVRAAGLGPMRARSWILSQLPTLVASAPASPANSGQQSARVAGSGPPGRGTDAD